MVGVRDSLLSTYDYFSLDLLLRTLFSPFRQISAGKVRGPIGVQLRALLDNLISRTIGAIVRSIVIVVGSVTLCISSLLGFVKILLWPFIPLLPLILAVVAASGWIPWMI